MVKKRIILHTVPTSNGGRTFFPVQQPVERKLKPHTFEMPKVREIVRSK